MLYQFFIVLFSLVAAVVLTVMANRFVVSRKSPQKIAKSFGYFVDEWLPDEHRNLFVVFGNVSGIDMLVYLMHVIKA